MKFLCRVSVKVSVILIFAVSVVSSNEIQIPERVVTGDVGGKMSEFLTRLNAFDFNGSVLVAQKGNIILHDAYGLAQAENGVRNHTSTLFSTGSVTKQFTATAIMKLAMEERLTVNDSLGRFFDNVPEDKAGITIHHLLTHTAGLPPQGGPDNESISRDAFLKKYFEHPLESPPGERYEYSNLGFSIAAAIIEKITGMTYEKYMKEDLFLPAGMKHTGLHLLDVPDTLISHSHNENMDYPSPADRPRDCWNLMGNGGILSTPADMYRWHRAVWDNILLSEEYRDKLFTPYVLEFEDADSYYGYGWVIQQSQRRDSRVIWHNGGAMPHGWSCAVYYYVEDDAFFIIFSNKPIEGILPVDHIAVSLSQILFGEPIIMPPDIADIKIDHPESLEGKYSLGDDILLNVFVRNNALHIVPEGQYTVDALFPSPMAPRLPKYNDKTSKMVTLLSQGDFEKAASYWEIFPGDDGAAMLEEFWHEFDSLGEFRNMKILGTKMGGSAETYTVLEFENGVDSVCFLWMGGMCVGATSNKRLEKILYPQTQNSFAGYSLGMGDIFTAEFSSDNEMTFSAGGRKVQAKKQK